MRNPLEGLPADAATIRELDQRHLLRPWSALTQAESPIVRSAEGVRFTDDQGRSYLDFASQLVNLNLGHQHPRLIAAIQEYAAGATMIQAGFANDARGEVARLIAEVAPPGLDRVFFTSGGAEAIENAVRMARVHTGRTKVFAAYRSYHGATAGAIALTGDPRRWAAEPLPGGVVHFWGPYLYRSAFNAENEVEESARALQHLRDTLMVEGPQTVAAILLETVVGTNGILVPPAGYLQGVREICDEYGILLITDEVMAGFGRCGEWFAVDRWDVVPDLIAFAKGVNSGYLPLGGVVLHDRVADTFRSRPYPGGLTYSGHPLACASAVASINILRDEQVIEHARFLGAEVIGPGLAKIADRHPAVGDVRGLGVFWAVELVLDRATREPLVPFNAGPDALEPMREFAAACRSLGLWPMVHANRIYVVPPCITTEEETRQGLEIIDEALNIVDRRYRGSC